MLESLTCLRVIKEWRKKERKKEEYEMKEIIFVQSVQVADIEVLLSYRKTGKLQHLLALSIMSIAFMRL